MIGQGAFHGLATLAIAATLSLLMPTDAAARDADRCFTSNHVRTFEAYRLDGHGGRRGSSCLSELHDGLAALRLPAEGEDIDNVATAGGSSAYRWGFINEAGELAIPPRFERVGHFQAGLAAAYDGAHWGYIDRRGDWAIEPRFDEVQAFGDGGIAAVVLEGDWRLIDRAGKPVDAPLQDPVARFRVGDGSPVRVEVEYEDTYENADGETLAVPEGVTLVEPLGSSGLFIARRDYRYGLIDADLEWQVEPDYQDIRVPSQPGAVAVASDSPEGDALIRQDGSMVVKGASVARFNEALWYARRPDGTYAAFDLQGERLAEFDAQAGRRAREMGAFLVVPGDESTEVLGPAFTEPVSLAPGVTLKEAPAADFLVVFDGDTLSGVILESGTYLSAKDSGDWFQTIDYVERQGDWTWLRNQQKTLLQIAGPDGRPLLDKSTLERLGEYNVEPREVEEGAAGDQPVAIALVSECPYHHCKPGAGLLMADGQLVLHEDWHKVEPVYADEFVDERRFVFHTDEGVGILDGAGSVLLAAKQQHIDDFHNGHALVYGNGVTRVVDRSGQLFDVPNGFAMSVVAPGVVRYRKSASEEALFSLYDLVAQQPITEPRFQDVGDFQDGQAVAVSSDGKAGVIDRAGEWVLAPAYAAVEPVNGRLWIVQRRLGSDAFEDVPRALVDAEGEIVVPYTEGRLSAELLDNGNVEAGALGNDGVHRLLSPAGEILIDGHEVAFSVMGDWIKRRHRTATGYLGDNGEWAVALEPGMGSDFHAESQRALRYTDEGTEIIDAEGAVVATLPEGEWYWPVDASRIIGRVREGSSTTTKYADPSGEITLSVDGEAGVFHNDTALVSRSNGQDGFWINASGERLAMPERYSDLGLPADNGLAYAAREDRYGFIDKDGRYIISPVYDQVTDFENGRAIVTTAQSAMLIDQQGSTIARVTNECGVRVLYGPDKERLWPTRLPQRCR
ncbi:MULTISPECIES: WG repeat-containing protein [unclassified Modicisalibacter]|uniref:WG repeat-containing protein n=1 Tax=unclassified Modicisalibacter TaxID=2679913 RepID=UPI001CC97E24|nr:MULTISPECIES: WG repeat-containing protein [unclassified Modicisalibacter]MBZ9559506.1 WG repeat-containing protein [Modicisalibacter sp. R2A 31.J]MBZ9576958.1 WG repeat-containing protein [Modicisalibacter sp. MOD 31.J]